LGSARLLSFHNARSANMYIIARVIITFQLQFAAQICIFESLLSCFVFCRQDNWNQ